MNVGEPGIAMPDEIALHVGDEHPARPRPRKPEQGAGRRNGRTSGRGARGRAAGQGQRQRRAAGRYRAAAGRRCAARWRARGRARARRDPAVQGQARAPRAAERRDRDGRLSSRSMPGPLCRGLHRRQEDGPHAPLVKIPLAPGRHKVRAVAVESGRRAGVPHPGSTPRKTADEADASSPATIDLVGRATQRSEDILCGVPGRSPWRSCDRRCTWRRQAARADDERPDLDDGATGDGCPQVRAGLARAGEGPVLGQDSGPEDMKIRSIACWARSGSARTTRTQAHRYFRSLRWRWSPRPSAGARRLAQISDRSGPPGTYDERRVAALAVRLQGGRYAAAACAARVSSAADPAELVGGARVVYRLADGSGNRILEASGPWLADRARAHDRARDPDVCRPGRVRQPPESRSAPGSERPAEAGAGRSPRSRRAVIIRGAPAPARRRRRRSTVAGMCGAAATVAAAGAGGYFAWQAGKDRGRAGAA